MNEKTAPKRLRVGGMTLNPQHVDGVELRYNGCTVLMAGERRPVALDEAAQVALREALEALGWSAIPAVGYVNPGRIMSIGDGARELVMAGGGYIALGGALPTWVETWLAG